MIAARPRRFGCALALAVACGCIGTETGNPPARTQLALRATSRDPDRVAVGQPGAVRLTQAWIGVERIRIDGVEETCEGPGPSERLDVHDRLTGELVTGAGLRARFDKPEGGYCRVRLALARARAPLPSSAPAELDGASFVLVIVRGDGAEVHVVSQLERELEVRSRGEPFELREGLSALLLAFDAADWLGSVDWDALSADGGLVRIDRDRHSEALQQIERGLVRALRLYRDLDGDGGFSGEEARATPLADSAP
ncbi:MAG: hypothetical protein NZ898_08845 [Myxococcota bacterium]|nr:hypothetical protein [Myxococcota bacterium]MDW8360898.1 hypothetical protein [Myxococcales bacterium]